MLSKCVGQWLKPLFPPLNTSLAVVCVFDCAKTPVMCSPYTPINLKTNYNSLM